MENIVVLGSINVDLFTRVKEFPRIGETIIGTNFFITEGGKGANQAVAISKLGSNVTMLGKVGDDAYGDNYLTTLKSLNVDISKINRENGTHTGIAVITSTESSQNSIIIVPGANSTVDIKYLEQHKNSIINARYLMLQFEIPYSTIEESLILANSNNTITIVDPAPALPIDPSLYKRIDYLTPNTIEAEVLSGIKIDSTESAKKASEFFLQKGVKNLIIKHGSKGSYFFNQNMGLYFKGFNVKAVDTTAAGDTFNGAFAYALSNNYDIAEALIFANAAAALSVQKSGAQISMPNSVEEVTKLALTASEIINI